MSHRIFVSATVTLAFPVSHFIDIRAKPHQFPLVELDWHFGNPRAQERFKSSHLRSKRNVEFSYWLQMAQKKKKKKEGRSGRKRRNKGQKNVDVNEKEKRFNREG